MDVMINSRIEVTFKALQSNCAQSPMAAHILYDYFSLIDIAATCIRFDNYHKIRFDDDHYHSDRMNHKFKLPTSVA